MADDQEPELKLDLSQHHILENLGQEREGHLYGTATATSAIASPLLTQKQPDGATRFYGRVRGRIIRVVATLKPSGRWFLRTVHDDEGETKRSRRELPDA